MEVTSAASVDEALQRRRARVSCAGLLKSGQNKNNNLRKSEDPNEPAKGQPRIRGRTNVGAWENRPTAGHPKRGGTRGWMVLGRSTRASPDLRTASINGAIKNNKNNNNRICIISGRIKFLRKGECPGDRGAS